MKFEVFLLEGGDLWRVIVIAITIRYPATEQSWIYALSKGLLDFPCVKEVMKWSKEPYKEFFPGIVAQIENFYTFFFRKWMTALWIPRRLIKKLMHCIMTFGWVNYIVVVFTGEYCSLLFHIFFWFFWMLIFFFILCFWLYFFQERYHIFIIEKTDYNTMSKCKCSKQSFS